MNTNQIQKTHSAAFNGLLTTDNRDSRYDRLSVRFHIRTFIALILASFAALMILAPTAGAQGTGDVSVTTKGKSYIWVNNGKETVYVAYTYTNLATGREVRAEHTIYPSYGPDDKTGGSWIGYTKDITKPIIFSQRTVKTREN